MYSTKNEQSNCKLHFDPAITMGYGADTRRTDGRIDGRMDGRELSPVHLDVSV